MVVNNPNPVVVDPPANVATGSASATIWTAFIRSAWSSIAAACFSGLTAFQVMDGTMSDESALRKAIIVGAITFFGPTVARGGMEGVYDSARQKSGNATPADVTPTPIK
jgi:hypothetical protein